MSYRKTAKLSNLRGGQDSRKGHNHGKTEGFKEVACDTQRALVKRIVSMKRISH
jgi:hypothetical protein